MSLGDDIKQAAATDPFGKLMMAVIMALVLWIANATRENVTAIAIQNVRMTSLQEQLLGISADRYTGAQARSDFALLEQRIERLEDGYRGLAERLRLSERAHRTEN